MFATRPALSRLPAVAAKAQIAALRTVGDPEKRYEIRWRMTRALYQHGFTAQEPTSTLNPQPSTLNPQPSTLNPQPSTLNPRFIVPGISRIRTPAL